MGGATVATAAVTHSADIRGIVLEYPAINLDPDAMVRGAPLDVNGYTLRDDHAELIVYEGQPHVFTGKYKVLAVKEIYRFLEEAAS